MNFLYVQGDPLSTSMIWLTLIIGTLGLFRSPQLGIAVIFSLATAILLSEFGYKHLHAHAMLICAGVCVVGISCGDAVKLDIETHETYYAIAMLYVLRAVIEGLQTYEILSTEIAWIASSVVLLFVQLALVLGVCAHDRTKRLIDRGIARSRHLLFTPIFNSGRNDR